VIESLADRDITRFDDIIQMKVTRVLTHLTYMKDWVQAEKQKIKALNKHV